MSQPSRRKCRHCQTLFVPDPRNQRPQFHCPKPVCRQARQAKARQRWKDAPVNRDYWKGDWNARRVREWQRALPGYWKNRGKQGTKVLQNVCFAQSADKKEDNPKVLQDVWQAQPPLILGLISKITGTVLQDDLARVTGELIASGRPWWAQTSKNDPQTNPQCRAAPTGAGLLQLC
jgi:hypothetical protein